MEEGGIELVGFILDTDWKAWKNGEARSIVLFTNRTSHSRFKQNPQGACCANRGSKESPYLNKDRASIEFGNELRAM